MDVVASKTESYPGKGERKLPMGEDGREHLERMEGQLAFIVGQQAKYEVRSAKADERWAEADKRWATSRRTLGQHRAKHPRSVSCC